MQLFIGTVSTWSLRALICARLADISIQTTFFNLADENDRRRLKQISPTALVPFLRDDQLEVHDSLAIAEYLNEKTSGRLYPEDPACRALSRSLCAEIHSGFINVRREMPFSPSDQCPAHILSDSTQNEVERLTQIFSLSQGEFMWGDRPTAVDAFYAVMALRLASYQVYLGGAAGEYQRRLIAWPLFNDALAFMANQE